MGAGDIVEDPKVGKWADCCVGSAGLWSLFCCGCGLVCVVIPALVLAYWGVAIVYLINAFFLGITAVAALVGLARKSWPLMACFIFICLCDVVLMVVRTILEQVNRDCEVAEEQNQDCDTYYITALIGGILGMFCCLAYAAAGFVEMRKFKQMEEAGEI